MHRITRYRDLFLGAELTGGSPLAAQTIDFTSIGSYRRNWRWCLCAVGVRFPAGATHEADTWGLESEVPIMVEGGGGEQRLGVDTSGTTPNANLALNADASTFSQQTDDGNGAMALSVDTLDGSDPTGTIHVYRSAPVVELDWLLTGSWQGQIRISPDSYTLRGSPDERPYVWARVRPVTHRELLELDGDRPGTVSDDVCR